MIAPLFLNTNTRSSSGYASAGTLNACMSFIEALLFLMATFTKKRLFSINFSSIRSGGSVLSTSGGYAYIARPIQSSWRLSQAIFSANCRYFRRKSSTSVFCIWSNSCKLLPMRLPMWESKSFSSLSPCFCTSFSKGLKGRTSISWRVSSSSSSCFPLWFTHTNM